MRVDSDFRWFYQKLDPKIKIKKMNVFIDIRLTLEKSI